MIYLMLTEQPTKRLDELSRNVLIEQNLHRKITRPVLKQAEAAPGAPRRRERTARAIRLHP